MGVATREPLGGLKRLHPGPCVGLVAQCVLARSRGYSGSYIDQDGMQEAIQVPLGRVKLPHPGLPVDSTARIASSVHPRGGSENLIDKDEVHG